MHNASTIDFSVSIIDFNAPMIHFHVRTLDCCAYTSYVYRTTIAHAVHIIIRNRPIMGLIILNGLRIKDILTFRVRGACGLHMRTA